MPAVRLLASANSSAATFGVLRSTSTALLSSISFGVSSAAETLSSAAIELRVGRLAVDRRDDVVGVLEFLVVLQDDELLTGDRGAPGAGGARLGRSVPDEPLVAAAGQEPCRGDGADRADRQACTCAHHARLPCPGATRPGRPRVRRAIRLSVAREYPPNIFRDGPTTRVSFVTASSPIGPAAAGHRALTGRVRPPASVRPTGASAGRARPGAAGHGAADAG